MVGFSMTPFPDLMKTTLRYTDVVAVNPGNVSYLYKYALNSIYDPNITGSGSQPMYHDQLSVMYNRYRVRACLFQTTVTGLNTPCRVAVSFANNDQLTTFDYVSESQWSQNAVINTMANGGLNQKVFRKYVVLSDLLGENTSDDRDQAQFGANPSNIALATINLASLDNATNMTAVSFFTEIRYYVELFDKINITGS
jgi:hypothetical protein